jgi:hypothetical protein
MANRAAPFSPIQGVTLINGSANCASAAVLLSYTVPVGKAAIIRFMQMSNFVNAPTCQLLFQRSGIAIALATGTTAATFTPNISLDAGDFARISCITPAVGASCDCIISVEEFNI